MRAFPSHPGTPTPDPQPAPRVEDTEPPRTPTAGDNQAAGDSTASVPATMDSTPLGPATTDSTPLGPAAFDSATSNSTPLDPETTDSTPPNSTPLGPATTDSTALSSTALGPAALGPAALGSATPGTATTCTIAFDSAEFDSIKVGRARGIDSRSRRADSVVGPLHREAMPAGAAQGDPSAGGSAPGFRGATGSSANALHRWGMLTGAATVLFSVAVAFAPSAAAASAAPSGENVTARVGILESTAAQPDPNAIAEDFVTEAGYRPVVEAGMLVNPGGDCSSPVPLPHEFDIACKAHDLGYDMLRYADSHGQPLGPWARQAVDAALDERMHASCRIRGDALDRAGCEFMAGVAATFVDLNSIRQDYGVPVHEAAFDGSLSPIVRYTAFGSLAAVFAATATFFARRARAPHTRSGVRITAARAVAL